MDIKYKVDEKNFCIVDCLSEKSGDGDRNFHIIGNSLKFCKTNNLPGIKFTNGVFPVFNKRAIELQKKLMFGEVSPTDNLYWNNHKNVLFDFSGRDGFSVIGNGTVFMAAGLMGIFDFTNVKNLTIEGIKVDWIEPLFFNAKVEGIINKRITVRALSKTSFIGGEPIVSFQNYDIITGRQRGMCVFCGISNLQKEENGLISFTSEDTEGLTVGDGIIARYIYNFAPVIHFYCCENINIENVTVNTSAGMGVIAHKCKNLNFRNYKDMPANGRIMSTITDATHFISCCGSINFDNCYFEGMGDDAVNVHGFYLTIKEIIGKDTVIAVQSADSQDGIIDMPDEMNHVEFIDGRTLSPFKKGVIKNVCLNGNNNEITISFFEELSEGVSIGTLIGNTDKTAKLFFKNSKVNNIRGRALLVQTRGAEIRNNLFENCTGQAIHIDTANGWMESIGTRDITILENKFIDCGFGITKYCDAVGVVVETEAEQPTPGVHRDIAILDNYVQGENVGIKIMCANDVKISGNTFSGCRGKYEISFSENVWIE